jgi:hypothetical protein
MTNRLSNYKIKVNSEAVASIHDDGVNILHTCNWRLFSSNRTGAFIWRCLEQQLPLEAIAEKINSEYQIARTTALDHTAHFVAELERHGLIEREAKS